MKVAVECPGCGASAEIELGRRSAEFFCIRCDYPLFWVSTAPVLEGDTADAGMVLRRRPGAAGIRLPATLPCPACHELNPVGGTVCLRCGSPMQPEPEPEPVVVAEPPPPPPPEPEPAVSRWQPWMTVLVAVLAALVTGALLLWLLTR